MEATGRGSDSPCGPPPLRSEHALLTHSAPVSSFGAKSLPGLGKTPRFLSDTPLDEFTRKLRLTTANFPKQQFESAKPSLETSLRVYIDEIRENRTYGCIDIIYSYQPMSTHEALGELINLKKFHFKIGAARSRCIIGNLCETPHLLVAGQTGGGKSTFLRQLITTLYLKNESMAFVLIDLKGGLEFQLFEDLPRINVLPGISQAINELKRVEQQMLSRMDLLKKNKVKDIDAFNKAMSKAEKSKRSQNPVKRLGRLLLIVDEATEIFLTGSHATATEVQKSRRILSQIARQGRAVGVHLVIATQRPDTRSLDPQVKANLTGVLCFPMANAASSMTVLGNGRATELPAITGRAIWKSGIEMVEVQTPYLSSEDAERFLAPYRKEIAVAVCDEAPSKENRSSGTDLTPPSHSWLE